MKFNRKTQVILVLLVILCLQVMLRLPFLSVPLERDEGAYGYIAQRMLEGEVPYRDVFDHKPPLVYFIYAGLIKSFGNSIEAIRIPTLFYSLLSTIALFYLGYLLWGAGVGLAAALFYAVFSGGVLIQGPSSNTETFMVLPLILALILFVKGQKVARFYFLAGLFSGIALMLKQVAVFNFLVLLLFLFSFKEKRVNIDFKSMSYLFGGCLIIPLIFFLYFLYRGALVDFINAVFLVNRKYLLSVPGNFITRMFYGFSVLLTFANLENSIIWIFGFSGLIFILVKERLKENILIVVWAAASLIGVAVSGLFFGHYFIQLIPALCLLSGYALKRKFSFYGTVVIFLFTVLLLINIFNFQYPFYYKYTPLEISEHQYGTKSFAISYQISKEFKKFLKPKDSILVWSANPEIYFYLNKKSPTKYFNYLKWMEDDKTKKEVLSSIFKEKPDYIIWARYNLGYKEMRDLIRREYKPFMRVEEWKVYKRKS